MDEMQRTRVKHCSLFSPKEHIGRVYADASNQPSTAKTQRPYFPYFAELQLVCKNAKQLALLHIGNRAGFLGVGAGVGVRGVRVSTA